MKKVLLPLMTLLLVLGMLVPVPAMAKTNWDFEGWRVDAGKWMDGKLFTWYEGDWVPFRLCVRGYDGNVLDIGIQHDYMDARDDFGVDGAGNFFIGPKTPRGTLPGSITRIHEPGDGVFHVEEPEFIPVSNGEMIEYHFIIDDPYTLSSLSKGNFAFYWEAHLARTGSSAEHDGTTIIDYGSSYWNGASLHGHTSATGQQDVPIQTPPQVTLNPDIQVIKTADPTTIHSGDSVTYTYTVKNTGDCDLDNIVVTDDQDLVPLYVSGDDSDGLLNHDETWVYEATATPTADVTNWGQACGEDELDLKVCDGDDATVDVLGPNIEVIKTADPTTIHSGDSVTYTYTVKNTGDCDLDNIVVTDDQGLDPLYVSGDDSDGLLNFDETWVYEATATPTADVTNWGEACGKDELGLEVCDRDDATVDVLNPDIQVIKTAHPTIICYSGGLVTYTYEVTNTGDCDLFNVSLVDDNGTPGDDVPITLVDLTNLDSDLQADDLAQGASATGTYTRAIYSDTHNIATAKGYDELGSEVTGQDDAYVDVLCSWCIPWCIPCGTPCGSDGVYHPDFSAFIARWLTTM